MNTDRLPLTKLANFQCGCVDPWALTAVGAETVMIIVRGSLQNLVKLCVFVHLVNLLLDKPQNNNV